MRLTRLQLAAVTAASILASGMVIATALGRTKAQAQAVALLSRSRVERVVLPRRPPPPAPAPVSPPAPVVEPAISSPSPPSTPTTTTTTTTTTTPATSTTPTKAPPTPVPSKVKHVFIIAMTTPSYRAAFGPGSAMTYLNHRLRPEGDLLSGYESLGSTALPDYLAMVSGQAPNDDTEHGCTTYTEFPSQAAPSKAGDVPGRGCVYPSTIVTAGDQLDRLKGWKGYFEGMGDGLPAAQQSCQHPNSNSVDTTLTPAATPVGSTTTPATTTTPVTGTTTSPVTGTTTVPATGTAAPVAGGYVTSQNPFVYFHSLLDLGDCQSNDLPLTRLSGGLRSGPQTANLVYIAPDRCDDGSETPCPGAKESGLAAADAFLKQWVPVILRSPAYRENGVLIIALAPTADQLAAGAAVGPPFRTGALVISRYARAGSTDRTRYTPYSVLRSIEDLFALTPLAHAKSAVSFARAALPGAWAKGG